MAVQRAKEKYMEGQRKWTLYLFIFYVDKNHNMHN